ncbi:glycosyltransferase [Paenibacillus barengoltzii]|uniref:Glycosyltransferase subfamily 4-like N-terminal domain-containing protein n=1 Tax=Paenibacillus barengoltzii G22 TaxID=1235795 RepID=R9L6R1_9BACL|nr:glycosyltransferase [Paenibacillus barengoltzii]EOS54330.1 hypothetical protein C812_03570 [Paenibacillus barengoltzii G22]
MKIAYLIHWNEGPESGVAKKVIGQMAEWARSGHEVAFFLFTHRQIRAWEEALHNVTLAAQVYDKGTGRLSAFRQLLDRIRDWNPDVIYHRYDLYYPGLPKLLKQFPSILEMNTNDLAEMKQLGSKARYGYHLATRSRVLRAAQGFVFVSGEMAEERHYKKYVKDKVIIGNGYALDRVSTAPVVQRDEIRVIFIGSSGQSWQGVDHIAALARMRPSWTFDIVGFAPEDFKEPAPENMLFHGRLDRRDYEPLMYQADVAIGTMALYRKGMNEASPLKVREYLAYGLPVIIGYQDTDFPESVPFLLQLPNASGNLEHHLAEIDAFVQSWRGKRVLREQIQHLDNRVKEIVRLEYMDRIRKKVSQP